MFGDIGAVVGVAKCSRQGIDEAADGRAEHDRVAVQQYELGVGIHRGQCVEVERVMGTLERPPAADTAVLEHLQRKAVILVGRTLVDL